MWYKTGTVTYKAGSAILTGKDTLWADDKMGITPGDLVLISITDDNVMMAEIKTIKSNTEIELRTAFNKDSVTDTKYAIINTLNETIADFAKRISAAILYFNQQAEKIDNFLPKGANITLNGSGKETSFGIGNTDSYWMNKKSNKTLQLKDDGRLTYADGEVYHVGRKPTPAEIGAAKLNGDEEQDFFAKRIYLKSEKTDRASIETTISGTSTFMDLKIIDDPGGNDKIRMMFGNLPMLEAYAQSGNAAAPANPIVRAHGVLHENTERVWSNANKPTLDTLGAASQDIGKRYTIDTRGLNKDWFYPVSFQLGQEWPTTRLSIKSTARGGADPFNQNSFVGFVSAGGWSDTPQIVSGVYSFYDQNERTLGGIYAGSKDFYGFVIYVRGDNVYQIESQVPPTLHKGQASLGTSANAAVFPAGAVTNPANSNLLLDLKTATHGFHCNRDITITGNSFLKNSLNLGNKLQLESKASNTMQLAIGDNDTGFGFRADGAVNLWSNSAIKGYFDPTHFVYNQVAATNADAFRAVYGGKGFLFRQDGGNMYFLLSTANGGWGTWTAHRPITISMTDGTTSFGCPTHLNGATYYNSNQYWKKKDGAVYEANLRLWGSGARQSVLEWGWGGLPYSMYLERNSGLANNQSKLSVNGQITGQVVNASDERLKHNIQKVDNALEIVEKLNGYTFQYNGTDVPNAGVIAQELIGVYDNAVFVGNNPNDEEDEDDYYTVDYNQLHALHIESIKELAAQNRELKAENETLRTTLEMLQSNVAGMIDERVQLLEMKLNALYNMKVNGVSTEAPPINNEETP